MTLLPVYNNPGLTTPRESPAAMLTAGRKEPGGGFVAGSTDRFWLGLATGADKKTARGSHPAFAAFNADKKVGHTPAQAFMRAVLVHDQIDAARKIDRGLYRGPARDHRVSNPSHQGPWCTGDGYAAHRWNGTAYEAIACGPDVCPHCEICPVRLVLLFYPRWDGTPFEAAGMPQILVKYVSKGRRMLESFEGMLQHARQQARSFNIEIQSWHGFPFSMTLSKRTAPGKRYTDVAFACDGDLIQWLRSQQERRELLGGGPLGLLADDNRTPEAYADEEDAVSPLSIKPAAVSGLSDDEKRAIEAAEIAAAQT